MNNFEIFSMFKTLDRKLKRQMDLRTSAEGINGIQACLIRYVHERDIVYQKDLEKDFKVRKSSITSMLNTMEKSGVIKRESEESDLRKKRIVLTDKGISIHNEIGKKLKELLDETFSDLTEEDRQNLENIFIKINSRTQGF